jgi:hypothetical protein
MIRLRALACFLCALIVWPSFVLAQGYPEATVSLLRESCSIRKDIPSAQIRDYCNCYVYFTQSQIPWRDFQLLDAAITAKGVMSLDDQEKAILKKSVEITYYCLLKTGR